MTHVSTGMPAIRLPVADRLRGFLADSRRSISEALARRKKYRQAVFELSHCSDRDLHDMGIVRCDIRRLARESLSPDSNGRSR